MFANMSTFDVLGLSISMLAMMAVASPAMAETITGPSKIDAVTVYPQSAEVTRAIKVKVPKGEHMIMLTDLPAGALPQSIRVEGKTTGKLEIGSVDSRRLAVPRADVALQAVERKALEDEIEKLKDDRNLLATAIQSAEAQKALVSNLTQLPGKLPASNGGTTALPDWNQLLALVGQGSAAAHKIVLDTGIKMREVDRKIEDLAKKLAALAPAQDDRTELKVFVNAADALDADLTIRYQVNGASWTPFYDARLATGSKAQPAKLQLIRRASIQQRTGEAWTDVALSLSTTRPIASTAAPELQMLSVDYESERPMPMSVGAAAPAPVARSMAKVAGAMSEVTDADNERRREDKAKLDAVAQTAATIETQAFQAIYGIAGKVTVAQTGEAKRVMITADDLDPSLNVRTVPRLDPTAYLYAKFALPKTAGAVLPGNVSLFRDGVFVGNGRVPQLQQGEDHELGFGADDLVKVKRIVNEDKKGETGYISTSRVEERNYTITVKNMRATPVTVQVFDRLPVSMQQDIKVEPVFRVPPTKRDVNDRRGTFVWDMALAADEEKSVAFGYKVTAPAGKPIQYRELTPAEIMQQNRLKY
jgi:uncharacterized protein (TIGR02231 family)